MFTKTEKWLILAIVAFAGIFSPFTSSIYFPAIPALTIAFNKSTELINLTVTMYIILQGISPMVWGTLSDNIGRRPITAACLIVLSLSCVGLALVPTSAYWLLMVLRCLQAAGSASTIAIGAGVISDISTPAERAGFFGFFLLGPMVGPSLAPVVGGALTQGLGWRSIFWFLCIASSACLVIIIIIMPETLLAVRFKTDKLSKLVYTPFVPVVGRKGAVPRDLPPKKKFQNPFGLFAKPDIVLLLIINAIICAVYYGVIASLSTLFEQTYPFLDTTKIGLCFLAVGGGMGVGSTTNGKLLDKWYVLERKRFAERLSRDSEKDVDVKTVDKLPDFPLERARLYFIPILIILLAGCTAGYGWALEKGANIAVPLVLQFIIGYMCIAIMNGSSTIMIDLVPGQGSAVTACNNLVRCGLSAVFVSVIELMFNSMGVGWTYVLLTGITLLSLPAIFLELRFGPEIRKKRLHAVPEQK
ncbi:MFS general substrate transporter [Macrolepiota fuliginosa MF-IS2]|uniref:MFS general substrate transporter n=1 Tax=Macrolepiota fuliginosa MF-IS2 TaxID=1400762 RepID=A0A9P6C6V8_9AGAR|nr:MFS general substrate transporter [Macrolepiota fuliginosa MF-IS2]